MIVWASEVYAEAEAEAEAESEAQAAEEMISVGRGKKGKRKGEHPCPLCPRRFGLPNSLALHLKWHWGASGLEWKRGTSPSCF